MAALKEALIQLAQTVDFQYLNMASKGTELEAQELEFAVLAAIRDDECVCECSTGFDSGVSFNLPIQFPPPTGTITFGTPARGYTAISQPFTYSASDATHYTARVDGLFIGVVTSPILLIDLAPDTAYVIEVTPHNNYGAGTPAETTVSTVAIGQTVTSGVGAAGEGAITFGTPSIATETISQPFTYDGTPVLGYFYRLDGGTQQVTESPIALVGLTPETEYHIEVATFNNGGTGDWYSTYVTTNAIPVYLTFGTPTIGLTTINQPFTYTGVTATSFNGFLDGVSIGAVTSPIELDGLEEDTLYEISVTPTSVLGDETTESTEVTTNVATDVPLGEIIFGSSTDITSTSFTVNYIYTGSDASGYIAHVEEIVATGGVPNDPIELTGNIIIDGAVTYPSFSVTGLTPSSWYLTTVTPINSLGEGIPTTLG